MIRHIVLLKYRTNATTAQIAQVFTVLENLKSVIPGLSNITCGKNDSPEDIACGYTHAFTIDFETAAHRDAYLPHPAHQAASAMIKELLMDVPNNVLVVDITI